MKFFFKTFCQFTKKKQINIKKFSNVDEKFVKLESAVMVDFALGLKENIVQ